MRKIDHICDGVVARYPEAHGFKLAVCVGFGRDYRPRVRFYRASAGKWTSPELVDPAHLAPLGKIEIDGPSRQHCVLTKALEALWTTPKLGFGPAHVALLVAGNDKQQPPPVLGPTARSGGAVVDGPDPCVCSHAPEEHGHDPEYPGSTACQADGPGEVDDPANGCDCIAYEADPGEA